MPKLLVKLAVPAVLAAWAAFSPQAFAQQATLFAVLNGANECNTASPPLCIQGDRNGSGSASVMILGSTQLCASIIVNNIDPPTAAHIHAGEQGKNGGVALTLTAPAAGNPGASVFCTAEAPAGLTKSIRDNPQGFYINVHNGAFPAGAVRGQLF